MVHLSNIKLFGNPGVQYREFLKTDTWKQILDKIKRPFITTKKVILVFTLNCNQYIFHIDSGFIFDGATILLIFVPLIGEGSDIRFMKAALIHDFFLDKRSEIYLKYFKNKFTINEYIKITTTLLNQILKQNYVSKIKSDIMSYLTHIWQISIFNRKLWKKLN